MKNLIVCCDGTWNDSGNRDDGELAPTNVFKLFNAVDLATREPRQLTRYQAGVGTAGPLDRLLGGAVGLGLSEDIRDCYQWLSAKYEPGDRLFLFGFSRGAFTARSLAGLICRFGIVMLNDVTESEAIVERVYRQGYRERRRLPKRIRFHADSDRIRFIGAWDTVGALGIPDDKALLNWFDRPDRDRFHDTSLSPRVDFARHAVAIDEQRGSFAPTLWNHANDGERVKQLWFPGVHSDVGGGYRECGLSDGALKWMIGESRAAGLVFRDRLVRQLRPDPSDVMHDSRTGLMKVLVTAPRSVPALGETDRFHDSVGIRRRDPPIGELAYLPERSFVNDEVEFDVYARQPWNRSGVYLEAGRTYRFEAHGRWLDRNIGCGPDGADDGVFHPGEIAHLAGRLMDWLERSYREMTGGEGQVDFLGSRRFEDADWFSLVGAIADGGNPHRDGTHERLTTFRIGSACELEPARSGYLYCFANDAWGFYGNNRGFVTVKIRRT